MDPLKLRFLTERYEKEKRYIRLIGEFTPSVKTKPITGKFYAKHDVLSLENAPEDYIKLIIRKKTATPKDLHPYPPPSANMDYGWFIEPLIPRSKDPRLHFPRKGNNFIKTEQKIRYLNRGLPVSKFNGIPFKS